MNKKIFTLAIGLLTGLATMAQVNLANFDFNGSSSLPSSATTTTTNIIASINGTESNAAYSGTASGSGAFVSNTTAGNALSMSGNTNTNTWTLNMGGSDLNKYMNFKIYFQSERSSTGATAITVSYSSDGSTFTALSQTISTGNAAYAESIVDLSGISTLNNQTAVYIRFTPSGASASGGTLRLDNLQIQGALSPWSMSGGNVNFTGGITATSFTTTGDAKINGNLTSGATTVSSLNSTGNASITGNASVLGTLSTNSLALNSLILNGSNNMGFSFLPASGSVGPRLYFGNQTPPSPQNITCNNTTNGTAGLYNMFGDGAQFYNYYGATTANVGRRVLTVGTDYSGASIDLAGTKDDGSPGILLMNYYCGKDISICGNVANGGGSNGKGGVVNIGQNMTLGQPYPFDVNTALNLKANGTTAVNIQSNALANVFNITQNGNTVIGINSNTSGYSATKMLNVIGDVCFANYATNGHTNDGFSGLEILGNNAIPSRRGISLESDPNGDFNFYINGNQGYGTNVVAAEFNWKNGGNANSPANLMTLNGAGQLILGSSTANANAPASNSAHSTALLQVKGDIVVGTGSTANIYVTQNGWADFVFDKNYKLMPLNELENFYRLNHHLPNVPTTKDIQEQGNNLGQTDVVLLQKVEENTLYIVELKKQLDAQQKLIEALTKKLADKK